MASVSDSTPLLELSNSDNTPTQLTTLDDINSLITAIILERYNPTNDAIITSLEDINAQHICYHYLYINFGHQRYNIINNRYTAYLHMIEHTIIELLTIYDYKTILLPLMRLELRDGRFTRYEAINEIIMYDLNFLPYCLTLNRATISADECLEVYLKMRGYRYRGITDGLKHSTSIIITNDYKIKKAFQYCNYYTSFSIELHPWMQYIHQLISNAAILDSQYFDIIKLKMMQLPAYQYGFIDEISAFLLMELQFITDICHLHYDCGYVFNFDIYTYIGQFLPKYMAMPHMHDPAISALLHNMILSNIDIRYPCEIHHISRAHTIYSLWNGTTPIAIHYKPPHNTGEPTIMIHTTSDTTTTDTTKSAVTIDKDVAGDTTTTTESAITSDKTVASSIDALVHPTSDMINHIITLHRMYYTSNNLVHLLELIHYLYKYKRINELIIEFSRHYAILRDFNRNYPIYIGLHAIVRYIYDAVEAVPSYVRFVKLLVRDYYNSIMTYKALGKNYRFISQLPCEKMSMLKDDKNKVICIICNECYDSNCMLCVSCNKYVAHYKCLKIYIDLVKQCPHCKS